MNWDSHELRDGVLTFPDGWYVDELLPIREDQVLAMISLLTREGRLEYDTIMDMDVPDVVEWSKFTNKRLKREAEYIRAESQKAQISRQGRRGGGRGRNKGNTQNMVVG